MWIVTPCVPRWPHSSPHRGQVIARLSHGSTYRRSHVDPFFALAICGVVFVAMLILSAVTEATR